MIDVNLVSQSRVDRRHFTLPNRNLSDLINHRPLARQNSLPFAIDRAVSYATVLLHHSTQHTVPVEESNGHRS